MYGLTNGQSAKLRSELENAARTMGYTQRIAERIALRVLYTEPANVPTIPPVVPATPAPAGWDAV
jgi:hypothetical protein